MRKTLYSSLMLAALSLFGTTVALAESDFERNKRDVDREYQRQQAEKTKEMMRDKTHDGVLRYRKGNESVGPTVKDGKPTIDYRTTF